VTLDTGWFAKKNLFSYLRPDPPQFAPGGDAWLESTPPVLAPFQALAGLEFTLEIGVERLHSHSLAQKGILADALHRQGIDCAGTGEAFGAFLTVRHGQASLIAKELEARGVKSDARGDCLRLCPDLLNSEDELERAARALGEVLR
jgi:kynureninase